MIPLHDDIPSSRIPYVNYAMIACCSITFLLQLTGPQGAGSLVERLGMIPARVMHPDQEIIVTEREPVRLPNGQIGVRQQKRAAAPSLVPAVLTVLTCIFLHGGWMHFGGNMLFLWIFGDNVEDRLGHAGFFIFYLFTGAAASLSHLVTAPQSMIPTIGASGAIAGVMGAYMFLHPKAQVKALIPLGYFMQIMVLPAPLFLGIWFAMQFFSGVASISATESTGVAWWAHIGGFVVGGVIAATLYYTGLLLSPAEKEPDQFYDSYFDQNDSYRDW